MLKLPAIVVNFKAFEQATGDKAIRLAETCERVAQKTGVTIAVAVQTADIYHVTMAVRIPVFAQHIDALEPGAHTGATLARDVKSAGAIGTLLNHAEKRLPLGTLQQSILQAQQAKLATLVCAATPEEAARVSMLQPDFIAIEPPELIGGDVAVSTARPGVITDTTSIVGQVPVLCGAGIKTGKDVAQALKLGAKGILVASGVVLAKNPEQVLLDFANAMQTFK